MTTVTLMNSSSSSSSLLATSSQSVCSSSVGASVPAIAWLPISSSSTRTIAAVAVGAILPAVVTPTPPPSARRSVCSAAAHVAKISPLHVFERLMKRTLQTLHETFIKEFEQSQKVECGAGDSIYYTRLFPPYSTNVVISRSRTPYLYERVNDTDFTAQKITTKIASRFVISHNFNATELRKNKQKIERIKGSSVPYKRLYNASLGYIAEELRRARLTYIVKNWDVVWAFFGIFALEPASASNIRDSRILQSALIDEVLQVDEDIAAQTVRHMSATDSISMSEDPPPPPPECACECCIL